MTRLCVAIFLISRLSRDFRNRMEQRADSMATVHEGAEPGTYARALEKIYEANKQTMRDPHSLYVGQKITIPLLDGKLFGEQTLPISSHSPDYPMKRPAAGTTNILELR